MKIRVAKEVAEKYPNVSIGVLVVKDMDNSNYDDKIQNLLRSVEEELKNRLKLEDVAEVPSVKRWREIYKSFGANPPSDFRNSAEAILKRCIKGKLPKINAIVDLYNYISAKYAMPVGGEDLDSIEGDLVLDFAKGNEEFIAIGSDENKPPKKGEVVYKDSKGVICRCWNWREGDRTKLSEDSKNAVLVIESILPENEVKFKEAIKELRDLVERYCKGKVSVSILNSDNLEVEA